MKFIPYGKHYIDDEDIASVEAVLRSDWLTGGKEVGRFEAALSSICDTKHTVALSSGTAALHAAMAALGIKEGDEVIVPPITFAATANSVLYCGGTPVFVDVEEDTLLLDPHKIAAAITPQTKAIVGVDYAGQLCDWKALRKIADKHNLHLVADSCHALGATQHGATIGEMVDMAILSFHPVKHIATGEGGAVTTNNPDIAEFIRQFRSHGITSDAKSREATGTWYYEMTSLGYNYRITDIQCALGLSQLNKFEKFLERRREIASLYDTLFAGTNVRPLKLKKGNAHAYHLYVVRVANRDSVFKTLRDKDIGPQVHYIPVHLHPYYRENLKTGEGDMPVAEAAYKEIISLPMFPLLEDEDVKYVAQTIIDAGSGS